MFVLANTSIQFKRRENVFANARLVGRARDVQQKLCRPVQMIVVSMGRATKVHATVCQIGQVNFVKFHHVLPS
jgi:hypothetical protein